MTIVFKKDRIEFDTFTLYERGDGFFFDGTIFASCTIDAFQGAVAGFLAGGYCTGAPGGVTNICKFSFTSESNQASAGNLVCPRYFVGGVSSPTEGFASGGGGPGVAGLSIIDKFPFATSSTSYQVGCLSAATYNTASATNGICGFEAGGCVNTPFITHCKIDRFPLTTYNFGQSTNIGSLSACRVGPRGTSSYTHGYASGGFVSPSTLYTCIDKFSFSTDVACGNIGNLSVTRQRSGNMSSTTCGYIAGGYAAWAPTYAGTTCIEKHSFTSDGNSTSVGTLGAVQKGNAGVSSTLYGYSLGGAPDSPVGHRRIERFPFASDSSISCVAVLSNDIVNSTGFQD